MNLVGAALAWYPMKIQTSLRSGWLYTQIHTVRGVGFSSDDNILSSPQCSRSTGGSGREHGYVETFILQNMLVSRTGAYVTAESVFRHALGSKDQS